MSRNILDDLEVNPPEMASDVLEIQRLSDHTHDHAAAIIKLADAPVIRNEDIED